MPRKLLEAAIVPTLVQERLLAWGRCIRAQRLVQRLTAAALCERAGISEGTLRRLERGDPGAAVSTYLAALNVLGVLDLAAPALPATLWSHQGGQRVKLSAAERPDPDDDDF